MILITDASDKSIRAVLCQENDKGNRRMIHTFSRNLDNAQRNYPVTDKELLAVVKSMDFFRHYLLDQRFKLETDHKALQYLNSTTNQTGRMMRWSLFFSDFDFEVIHVAEKNIADGLSRYINTVRKESLISEEQRNRILNSYHNASGHGSVNNMCFLLKQKYKWSKMYDDVRKFVRNCKICSKEGGLRQNTQHDPIKTNRPNEHWQIDLVGPLKTSNEQKKYVLVSIDHFTKWTEATILQLKELILWLLQLKNLSFKNTGFQKRF